MPNSLQAVVRSTLLLLGIGFTSLVFIVFATVWLSERAQSHLRVVTWAREARTAATLLRDSLLSSETSQRGYLLTGNEIYLAPYDNAKSVATVALDRLRAIYVDRSDRRELLSQLSFVVAEKIKEQDSTIALKTAKRDAEATEIITSNRGKALMDEANVYLSAISLEADDRLAIGVAEQTSNADWLRWTSIASAFVIVIVVGGVVTTLSRYTREIIAARDEVKRTNETLELRVAQRTEALSQARNRAEVLLGEVNHRVANSLALVSSLLRLQTRELKEPSARQALEETNARIQAIAQMHKHLFTTESVGAVAADVYLGTVLAQLEMAMANTGSNVKLNYELTPLTVATSDAVHLGIIITEWVTNAFKYAYPDGQGEVRVKMEKSSDQYVVSVEDDGIGWDDARQVKGTGFGTRVVTTIATTLKADVRYRTRNPGTAATLSLAIDRIPSTLATKHS